MKLANHISIRVFYSEEENSETIVGKLKELAGLDLEKEKIAFDEKSATGFGEKKIRIYEIELEKERHTTAFLKHLNEMLSNEQKEMLIKQLQSRLDEEFNFFLRLDKDNLIKDNAYRITETGNCYHIRINVACFPRNRSRATEAVKEIFK